MRFLRALLDLLRAPIAIASITPVALGPDDVIVLRLQEKRIAQHQVEILQRNFQAIWPGRKLLILDASMSMEVLRVPPGTAAVSSSRAKA